MRPTVLADSYARLGWVTSLATQARAILDAVEYERQMPSGIEEPLDHLAFLIGDLATNAWACLDMAVTQACEMHNVTVGNTSFPIRNPQLLKAIEGSSLPEPWKKAIRLLQPEDAEVELRSNVEAIWIRGVSNANKHRNLTRALHSRQQLVVGGGVVRSIVTEVTSDEDQSTPTVPAEVFIWDVQRFGKQRSDGTSLIGARTFVSSTLRYVRHALSTFRYAETDGASGREPSASHGVEILKAQMIHPSRSRHWVFED